MARIRRCSVLVAFAASVSSFSWYTINNIVGASQSQHISLLQRTLATTYEDYYNNEVEPWLDQNKAAIDDTVFISYDAQGNNPHSSKNYIYADFLKALYSMSVDGVGGDDDHMYFYTGQTDDKGLVYGLVNIAAFLAHAMALPSIKYDLCDEYNLDTTDNTDKYAISNSCGQWGRSYMDEGCEGKESFMTCNVYMNAFMTAVDSLPGDKTPPPLECKPKTSDTDFTGHWNSDLGQLSEIYPYSNRFGAIHYEGCCWWGRGIIQTRGTCNMGRLNFFIGRKAAEQGYINFFDVDICVYPEVICQGEDTRELRWSAGLFEWSDRVQTYTNTNEGLNYMKDLNTFVNSGFIDANRFIDVVGSALPLGCFESNCMIEEERIKQERRDSFIFIVFNVLKLPNLIGASPPPTRKPIQSRPVVVEPPSKQPTSKPTPQPLSTSSLGPTTQNTTSKATPTSQPQHVSIGNICSGVVLGTAYIPINDCKEYVECFDRAVVSQYSCPSGLIYDTTLGSCNWAFDVTCRINNIDNVVPKPPTTQQTLKPVLLSQPPPPPAFAGRLPTDSTFNITSDNQNNIANGPGSNTSIGQGAGLIKLPSDASLGATRFWAVCIVAIVGVFMILS